MLPVYKIWHTLLSTRILLSKLLLSFLKRTYVSRNALNLNLLNYNMKILQVAFLLLFKIHYIQIFDLRSIQSHNPLSLNTVYAMEHLCNSEQQNFTQCILLFPTLKGLLRQFIISKYSLY